MRDTTDDVRIHEALDLLNQVASEEKARLQEMLSQGYDSLKGFVETNGAEARREARHYFSVGKEKVGQAARVVDSSAHTSPWVYIGAAAAACLFVGFLLGRTGNSQVEV